MDELLAISLSQHFPQTLWLPSDTCANDIEKDAGKPLPDHLGLLVNWLGSFSSFRIEKSDRIDIDFVYGFGLFVLSMWFLTKRSSMDYESVVPHLWSSWGHGQLKHPIAGFLPVLAMLLTPWGRSSTLT